MIWIDENYLNQISTSLALFKQVDRGIYNCRCPICGDSAKNKYRARGYFYEGTDSLIYYCHNCTECLSFSKYLEQYHPELYTQYLFEKFSRSHEKLDTNTKFSDIIAPKSDDIFASLESNNPLAIKYLRDRHIEQTFHFTHEFQQWVNSVVPMKFAKPRPDSRVVIPLRGPLGEVYGFQGRSIGDNAIKYITITFPGCPKLFGMDSVDMNRTYYVLEGPLNSLFVDNAIASCGGDIVATLSTVPHIKENAVIIYDNEPRNKTIKKQLDKAIDLGYTVLLWPRNFFEAQDINDIISHQISNNNASLQDAKSYILDTIKNNTYSGLSAKLELSSWAKC